MRRYTLLLIVLAAAVAAPTGLGAGSAGSTGGEASFALTPVHFDRSVRESRSYFVIKAAPGATISNSVRVFNVGDTPGTIALYPVDATTGATSGAVYEGRNVARRDVGRWVSLGSSRVTLAPHSSTQVPVTVHVPAHAVPGDHLGGIVAQNLQLSAPPQQGDLHVRIRHLTIVAVEVQVPGPASAQLRLVGVRPGGARGFQYVYVKLENTGRLMMKPHGLFVVRNSKGQIIGSARLNLDLILPHTSIEYPVLLRGHVLDPGTYQANLRLAYNGIATGYRKKAGPVKHLSATLPLHVSEAQQRQVYKGAPPAKAPAAKGLPSYALWAGAATFLLLLAAVVLLGIRQWARRS